MGWGLGGFIFDLVRFGELDLLGGCVVLYLSRSRFGEGARGLVMLFSSSFGGLGRLGCMDGSDNSFCQGLLREMGWMGG